MKTITFQEKPSNYDVTVLHSEPFGYDFQLLHGAMYDQGVSEIHQIAYVLATAKHESANFSTMFENGSYDYFRRYDGRLGNISDTEDFYTYRGRGYTQITGRYNYNNFGNNLGVDLINNPDKAAEKPLAAQITAYGMKTGKFTGVGLSRFINEEEADYVNARKIINGLDRASDIAQIARTYEQEIESRLMWSDLSVVLDGTGETDSISFTAGSDKDTLIGGNGNDNLNGSDGNDQLYGGAGNDTLKGGDGNDTYILSSGTDTIEDTGDGDKIQSYSGTGTEKGENTGIYDLAGATVTKGGNGITIQHTDGTVNVMNWTDGKYKISLESKDKPNDEAKEAQQDYAQSSQSSISPIALDMNGSGAIERISFNTSSAYFDLDNDRFAERVEWLSSTDGWLVRDLNPNGRIDNQNELFGDGGGKTAYQKLAELNTDNTGTSANTITLADSAWTSLRIWIDANSNGVSEATELKTLSDLNITSLSLETTPLNSTFVRNGITYKAQDIFLQADQFDSWYQGTSAEISSAALALPQSRGYGDVKSMHYAASASPALMTKMQALDNLTMSGLDKYYSMLDNIIAEWAGVVNVERMDARRPLVDARHVAVMEKFSGNGQSYYTSNPSWNNYSNNDLESSYSTLASTISTRFLAQTVLNDVLGNPYYHMARDEMVFSAGYTEILNNARSMVPANSMDASVYWSEIARILLEYRSQFAVDEVVLKNAINSAAGRNVQIFSLGDRYFEGTNAHDSVAGNSELNFIYTYEGNDTLSSGAGSDWLQGGVGSDTYIYVQGDSRDKIFDKSNIGDTDVLILKNINYSDVTLRIVHDNGLRVAHPSANNTSLQITIQNNENAPLIIQNHLMSGGGTSDYAIEEIRFADGIVIPKQQISQAVNRATPWDDSIVGSGARDVISAMEGNDNVKGGSGDDVLFGREGSDYIYGDQGNDVLDGGEGSDRISGNDGNDTLLGGRGADAMYGGAGVDIFKFARISDSIAVLSDYIYDFNVAEDKIDISGLGFTTLDTDGGMTEQGELRLSIGSGTSLISDQTGFIVKLTGSINITNAMIIYQSPVSADVVTTGTSGKDTLLAGSGNDTMDAMGDNDYLYGFDGNDSMQGGSGNDTMFGGEGHDTIVGGNNADSMFGDGGNDIIQGGDGNDFLDGGQERDTLTGGADADIFRFTDATHSPLGWVDSITDFTPVVDKIDLRALPINRVVFASGTSPLNAARVVFWNGDTYITNHQLNFEVKLQGNVLAQLSGNDFLLSGLPLNGSVYDNTLVGSVGIDSIMGYDGDDELYGDWGNDTLIGGLGEDFLDGGQERDVLTGEAGADIFRFWEVNHSPLGSVDTITDFFAEDKIDLSNIPVNSFEHAERMSNVGEIRAVFWDGDTYITNHQLGFEVKLQGNVLSQLSSSNFIFSSAPLIHGTSGNDNLNNLATANAERIVGYAGNDSLHGQAGNDTIWGGDGADIIVGGSGIDSMMGDAGGDALYGDWGNDIMLGGDGNDLLDGGQNQDMLTGGAGADVFRFSAVDHSLMGAADRITDFQFGVDKINLSNIASLRQVVFYPSPIEFGTNTTSPLNGVRVLTRQGNTYVTNHNLGFEIQIDGDLTNQLTARDFIFSTPSAPIINGTPGIDSPLHGTTGNDIIYGLAGSDDIFALGGANTIVGGLGADYIGIEAGSGVNRITYLTATESSTINGGQGMDYIGGFRQGTDKIDLDALNYQSNQIVFGQFSTGSYMQSTTGDGFYIGFSGAYNFTVDDVLF